MPVTVKIPTQLRAATGGEGELEVEGATVGEALDAVFEQHDGLRDRITQDGALLADQVAEGRTISSFARVHANELAGTADQTAQGLSDAEVSSSKEADVNAAIALADDESGALGHLVVSPSDSGTAARVGSYLRRIARQAIRLEGSL